MTRADIYPQYRKGYAEFFGDLYPRLPIDIVLEAYSDKFVRVGSGNVRRTGHMERIVQRK